MNSIDNNKCQKVLARYAAAIGVGVLIAYLVAFHQGFSLDNSLQINCRHLSDGCFVAAILLGGIGGLVAISTTGFFDIFAYACHSFLVLFTALKRPKDQISFLDYKTMKAEKRRKPSYFLLITAALFLAASLITLAIYHNYLR